MRRRLAAATVLLAATVQSAIHQPGPFRPSNQASGASPAALARRDVGAASRRLALRESPVNSVDVASTMCIIPSAVRSRGGSG